MLRSSILAFMLFAAVLPRLALMADNNRLTLEDEEVSMQLVVRTPMQLSAFYQGREFNRAAIDEILKTCFITPIIKNKTIDVLWLELDQWRFSVDNQPIQRIKRDYWADRWREVDLPQSHQATFGWTLMPEIRDLRLDESVGGSVVIPMQSRPFTLIAHFRTGATRQGKPKAIVFEGIACSTEE
ncbi:MAG: hypothetical protein WBP02_02400 [Gammaproteobacteria bacterium]